MQIFSDVSSYPLGSGQNVVADSRNLRDHFEGFVL